MQHMNGRMVRKGLVYSKAVAAHWQAAAWEDARYNLVRQLKTLRQDAASTAARFTHRQRWRTPAEAAGLTDDG